MTKPLYILERWPHGWLFRPTDDDGGIPMDALGECLPVVGQGKAFMDAGIAHHYRVTGHPTVVCVGTAGNLKLWRAEIEATLPTDPQRRWWWGCDVGMSAAAIFAVFCDESLKDAAVEYSRGATPRDEDDLGRCRRLLALFPEWDLAKVVEAYPGTKWAEAVAELRKK